MDEQLRTVVEKLKKQVCEEAKGLDELNKTVMVSGVRHTLPLSTRDIDIVYYSAKKKNAPLIIGFHGGGFLFGGSALDDAMWNTMRDELDVNIASIGYRKTPEYRYPCAIEDAYESAIYLKDHASEFGFDKAHISTFGSSAGANIATSLCIIAKERGGITFDYQILNYPFLDLDTDPATKGEGTFELPIMIVFNELYCDAEETKLATASPLFATKDQLKGMPKTIIYMAQNDNLRSEGETYAQHLRDAGVEVIEGLAKGMPHAYFENGFGSDKLNINEDIQREARKCLQFIKANYLKS